MVLKRYEAAYLAARRCVLGCPSQFFCQEWTERCPENTMIKEFLKYMYYEQWGLEEEKFRRRKTTTYLDCLRNLVNILWFNNGLVKIYKKESYHSISSIQTDGF